MLRSFFEKRAQRKAEKAKIAAEKEAEAKRNPLVAVGTMKLVSTSVFDKEGTPCDLHVFFYQKAGKRWADYEFTLGYLKERATAMVKGEVRVWEELGTLPSWAKKVSA